MQQNNKATIDSPQSQKGNKQVQTSCNTIQVLKLQVQLNRMKKIMDMQVELHRNKEQYNQLSKEINEVQQQLKNKKKQIIGQKLLKLHLQQQERLNRNKQSNQILQKIKEERRQRRRKMESLVSQYKQEYQEVYQKRLSQRKSNLQLNPKHDSERKYLKKDNNHRMKTQSLDEIKQKKRRQRSFFQNPFKDEKQEMAIKKQKIMELVNKRILYGKKAEEESKNIKIPKHLIEQAKYIHNKGGYDKKIDKYAQQKSRYKKAKLDTNFSGDIQKNKYYEITKLANNDSPTGDKLNRLRYIVDGFNQQYSNGQTEVLDLMCKASIERANLLLKQS